jgi:hypothetical protein
MPVERVVPQNITVIGIFVSPDQLIHPLTHQLVEAVRNFVWVSPFLNALCQSKRRRAPVPLLDELEEYRHLNLIPGQKTDRLETDEDKNRTAVPNYTLSCHN